MGKGVSTDWLCHHTAEWHLHHHTSCSHPEANEICVETGVPFSVVSVVSLSFNVHAFQTMWIFSRPRPFSFLHPIPLFLSVHLKIRYKSFCLFFFFMFIWKWCFALKQCDVSAKRTVSMTVFDFGVCVCRSISDLKTLSKWRQPKH